MTKQFLASHLTVRSVDAAAGTAVFRINTPALDSDNECVLPRGCDTSQFNRNSPLLDSHQYDSVQHLLGTVTSLDISDDYIDAAVKFATDVEENTLAKLAFGMVKAGYLKACSVGFVPIASLRPSDGKRYNEAVKALDLPPGARPDKIHTQWALKELSICVMGANPEALVRSQKAAGLSDSDLATLGVKTQTHSTKNMPARSRLLEHLSQFSKPTKSAIEDIENARRNSSEEELSRIVTRALNLMDQERRYSNGDPAAAILADPQKRLAIDSAVRLHSGYAKFKPDGKALVETWQKSTMFGTSLAASIFPTDISKDILSSVLTYGAFRDLGVQLATNQQTQYAKMSQVPDAAFITPNSGMGVTTFTPDASLAGASLSDKMNTVVVLLPISEEWLQDATIDLAPLFMEMFPQALAKRIDYGCFQANGADDQTNGLQTGIFQSAATQANANAGNTTLAALQREDFLAAVGAVAAAALQRPCRWFINPAFIATLLTLREANGTQFLLKTPAETGNEWMLVGFPVTWAAQAPSATAPGSSIAAFGQAEGFTVAIREDLEIMSSNQGPSFQSNVRNVRALARSRSDMREVTFWSLLNLAAQ